MCCSKRFSGVGWLIFSKGLWNLSDKFAVHVGNSVVVFNVMKSNCFYICLLWFVNWKQILATAWCQICPCFVYNGNQRKSPVNFILGIGFSLVWGGGGGGGQGGPTPPPPPPPLFFFFFISSRNFRFLTFLAYKICFKPRRTLNGSQETLLGSFLFSPISRAPPAPCSPGLPPPCSPPYIITSSRPVRRNFEAWVFQRVPSRNCSRTDMNWGFCTQSILSNMAANTNHTILLKNQRAIKYLP